MIAATGIGHGSRRLIAQASQWMMQRSGPVEMKMSSPSTIFAIAQGRATGDGPGLST